MVTVAVLLGVAVTLAVSLRDTDWVTVTDSLGEGLSDWVTVTDGDVLTLGEALSVSVVVDVLDGDVDVDGVLDADSDMVAV